MSHPSRLASALAALGLAACGGGGDSTPAGSGITVSGTATAASLARMDSDTGDPRAPRVQNGTPGTAQAIPSAATVGGWASAATDVDDVYRATLATGQTVTLAIADAATADLDLFLFDVADTTTPVCASEGTGPTESCPVAAPGEYYVLVKAFLGASNYVLTVGQGATSAGSPDPGALRADAEFVPGEVVVRFRDDALLPAAAETLAARAASVGLLPLGGAPRREVLLGLGPGEEGRARAFAALGIERVPADAALEAADPVRAAKLDTLRVVKALRRRLDVAGADPNYVHRPSLVPDDTYYRFQWHYPAMNLPQAWDVTTGTPASGPAPIVAVVDTGVVLAHPDFSGQLVPGYDFISNAVAARDGNGIDPNPDDPGDATTAGQSSWHGTHVAGTVAAASNNGAGVAGVAWGAKVMPIRVLGVGGGTSYDIIQGIRWAAGLSNDSATFPARRADVINLSLGCLGCFAQTTQDAYTAVRNAGVVVVAAAGNENTSQLGYPASYAGVVSVSAVDMALARAPYSNFGATVDVAAPGGDASVDRDGNGYVDGVLSTLVNDARQPIYSFLQGTSMASPHVAGVVALMKAACPSLTPGDLDGLLAAGSMTRDLGAAGRDDVYGHGLVDALAAVSNCGTPPPATLSVAPSRLDFGTSATSLPLAASKTGTGTLTVSVSDDASWLTVTPTAVDADGIGSYAAAVSRSGLPAGIHTATITFTTSAPSTVAVPVTLQVGTGSGAGNAGHLYILLVDYSASPPRTVAQAEGNPSSGLYPFALANVPSGTYFLVAGTDSDNDDFICDDGEACGAYPTIGVPTPVDATQSRSGLGFTAGFEVPLGSASLGGPAGREGFRLLDAAKRVEVAR